MITLKEALTVIRDECDSHNDGCQACPLHSPTAPNLCEVQHTPPNEYKFLGDSAEVQSIFVRSE